MNHECAICGVEDCQQHTCQNCKHGTKPGTVGITDGCWERGPCGGVSKGWEAKE